MSVDQAPSPLRELAVLICTQMGNPVPRGRGGSPVQTSVYRQTYLLLLEARRQAETSDPNGWGAVKLKEGKMYTPDQARKILETLAKKLEEEDLSTDNRRKIMRPTSGAVRSVINNISPLVRR